MFSAIVSSAPIWVWPLLVLLIILGLRSSRTRTVPTVFSYLLPLMSILSLRSVSALPVAQTIWIFFGAAWLTGSYGGYVFQRKRLISKSPRRVTLKGEWLTMFVLMLIFWMQFGSGVVKAISPETYASGNFHIMFASITGLVAGTFIGRALCLIIAPNTEPV